MTTKVYADIVEHVCRDLALGGNDLPPTDRVLVARTINVLYALGYIPNVAGMEKLRAEHVAAMRAASVSEAAIG